MEKEHPAKPEEPKSEYQDKKETGTERKSLKEPNFLPHILNKKVEIITINGETISSKFMGFNRYEIRLKLADEKELLLWKHGLLSISVVE